MKSKQKNCQFIASHILVTFTNVIAHTGLGDMKNHPMMINFSYASMSTHVIKILSILMLSCTIKQKKGYILFKICVGVPLYKLKQLSRKKIK